MKIEEGKLYVDGRGHIIGPMIRDDGCAEYPFCAIEENGYCPMYTEEGVFDLKSPDSLRNLVEEYVAPGKNSVLELKEGHYYKSREGHVVGPVGKSLNWTSNTNYPFYVEQYPGRRFRVEYTASGRYWVGDSDNHEDLVQDMGVFAPALEIENEKSCTALSYAEELASIARRKQPYLRLLEEDDEFCNAARDLEQELAHALLTKGYATRRKKQASQLFRAACYLLAVRGVDLTVEYNNTDTETSGVRLFK